MLDMDINVKAAQCVLVQLSITTLQRGPIRPRRLPFRMILGIVMGYRLQAPATWRGEYIVVGLPVFVDKHVRIDVSDAWSNAYHPVTHK